MKTQLPWLALPAIVTAMACAPPAQAAAVTYTYTGFVDTGVDQIGLFGGGALDHQAFTAVFTRDDALAEDFFEGDVFTAVYGGAAVTGRLTIGSTTIDVGGLSGEQSQFDNGTDLEGFAHGVLGELGAISFFVATAGTFAPVTYDYLAGPDYHTLTSLTADGTPGLSWSGRFDFGAADPTDENRGLFTTGRFVPTALVVSPNPGGVSAVPEPASWAMMILGVAGLGATLRRRRALAWA